MRTFLIAAVCAALVVGATAAVIGVFVAMSDSGTSVFELRAGDCFDLPEFDDEGSRPMLEWSEVDTVDCADPHTVEVVLTGQLDREQEREFPGDAALQVDVDERCAAVAARARELRYGVLPITPNQSAWRPRGGPFLCVAIPFGGDPRPGSILLEVTAHTGG